jgi:hypothetical protein
MKELGRAVDHAINSLVIAYADVIPTLDMPAEYVALLRNRNSSTASTLFQ